ncbi:tRNA (adenosine(37)-N6)-threonylcarbamoyltransferase complex dimerization subunit type 1 TsaB [Wenyingzhuangia sp. 1_MG-2023]|nr:tRNA (adenosine(37)-N6)-threonylcarbamoyltransferase complex dimerization subunit type 1 TsaB [Wenyingzhuangia sp. 1_MG-2023]
MALILNIETSTKNCSVSIAKEGTCIALKEENNGNYSHAEKLHVFIEDILKEQQLKISDLDAIAVGKGPGSYTGLRIGVSTAKGLAYAADIPLIAIDTLKALAKSITIEKGLIVPMIDARRLEVYSAIFDANFDLVRDVEAQIIDETSFKTYFDANQTLYFLGDGAAKCKSILTNSNTVFIDDHFPSTQEMCALAELKFKDKAFEDTAYFEPFYLKDFMVTPSKK